MPQSQENKTVAIARFSALGDVAMTVPVLYDACAANPGTRFVMLTRKAFVPIFVNKPANLQVVGLDLKGEHKGVGGMLRVAASLHADVFVDLHSVLRTWVMGTRLRLGGVRVSVFDKCRAAKRRLVSKGAMEASPLSAVVDRYAEAFERAGIRVSGDTFRGLYARTAADASLYASLTPPRAAGERWIGVAPFAAHAGKIYPADRMRNVVNALAAMPNTKVFLFGGGAEETRRLTEWASAFPGKIVCVAGSRLGFAAELSLMSALNVMVSMDSGNMHLAAIAGTRTVSVWGATHPAAGFAPWAPAGAPANWHIMVQKELDCRPCSVFGNRPCHRADGAVCMTHISENEVLNAIKEML